MVGGVGGWRSRCGRAQRRPDSGFRRRCDSLIRWYVREAATEWGGGGSGGTAPRFTVAIQHSSRNTDSRLDSLVIMIFQKEAASMNYGGGCEGSGVSARGGGSGGGGSSAGDGGSVGGGGSGDVSSQTLRRLTELEGFANGVKGDMKGHQGVPLENPSNTQHSAAPDALLAPTALRTA